jgi:hypothetical protein
VYRLLLLLIASLCGVAGTPLASQAYNLFGPYPWGEDQTYYLKWGDIFQSGSAGGTITWSLMPDGTTIDPAFTDPNISGTSSLTAIMNGLGYAEAFKAIQRAFDRWSAVANIYFEQAPDSGVPFHSVDAVAPNTGAIRLGAFPINAGIGAVGYAPPPNGGTLEGDVLLNASSTFFFDDGAEGELIDVFNDFEGLLVHEIGHAIGLAHSDVCSVMSVDFECYKYVNRELDPDDIAAAQFLYGPALSADFDRDNDVDGQDLAAWATGFGAASGAERSDGDADRDGDVDGADFLLVQQETSGAATINTLWAGVPEPAGLSLASGMAGAWMVLWRRRR